MVRAGHAGGGKKQGCACASGLYHDRLRHLQATALLQTSGCNNPVIIRRLLRRATTPPHPTPGAGVKYGVKAVRLGPQAFRLHLGSTHVDVVVRKLNDGGLLVQVGWEGGQPAAGQRATPLALAAPACRAILARCLRCTHLSRAPVWQA